MFGGFFRLAKRAVEHVSRCLVGRRWVVCLLDECREPCDGRELNSEEPLLRAGDDLRSRTPVHAADRGAEDGGLFTLGTCARMRRASLLHGVPSLHGVSLRFDGSAWCVLVCCQGLSHNTNPCRCLDSVPRCLLSRYWAAHPCHHHVTHSRQHAVYFDGPSSAPTAGPAP